jgi:hypothetical protein
MTTTRGADAGRPVGDVLEHPQRAGIGPEASGLHGCPRTGLWGRRCGHQQAKGRVAADRREAAACAPDDARISRRSMLRSSTWNGGSAVALTGHRKGTSVRDGVHPQVLLSRNTEAAERLQIFDGVQRCRSLSSGPMLPWRVARPGTRGRPQCPSDRRMPGGAWRAPAHLAWRLSPLAVRTCRALRNGPGLPAGTEHPCGPGHCFAFFGLPAGRLLDGTYFLQSGFCGCDHDHTR